ncbi:hypothetical protein QQ045_033390 [Rhodiola kirilowii]
MAIGFRLFFLALLLLAAPLLQVVRSESESDPDLDIVEPAEGGDIGIVGEDVHDFIEETFSAAPGIETITVFPKNVGKLVTAGEETELLVGLENNGGTNLNVISIKASVHLPYDHRLLVQNLTAQ